MAEQETDCILCRKHQGVIPSPGGVLYVDALVYARHTFLAADGPTYRGYLFAETQRHVPTLGALTDAEAQALGLLVTRLSRALEARAGAEHVYAFVPGDHVPHVHVHVVPRYPGAPQSTGGCRWTPGRGRRAAGCPRWKQSAPACMRT
jgi:histidine triad (HIT) family protein